MGFQSLDLLGWNKKSPSAREGLCFHAQFNVVSKNCPSKIHRRGATKPPASCIMAAKDAKYNAPTRRLNSIGVRSEGEAELRPCHRFEKGVLILSAVFYIVTSYQGVAVGF